MHLHNLLDGPRKALSAIASRHIAGSMPAAFDEPVIIPPAPPPVPGKDRQPEAMIDLDRLVDLALVMRELWMQDAGFAGNGDRARSMVLAALLRLFPDRAEVTVSDCLARHCPAGRCDDCPADGKTPAAWLDAFLSGLPRPTVDVKLPVADHPRLLRELAGRVAARLEEGAR